MNTWEKRVTRWICASKLRKERGLAGGLDSGIGGYNVQVSLRSGFSFQGGVHPKEGIPRSDWAGKSEVMSENRTRDRCDCNERLKGGTRSSPRSRLEREGGDGMRDNVEPAQHAL